ncbi:hypothetical protein [Archaeoglobus sp.]
MEGLNEKGQMMILFSLVVASIVVTLSVLYSQNLIAGIETSNTMFAYPKEIIRNLEEIKSYAASNQSIRNQIENIRYQIKIFCAEKGYVCSIEQENGKYYVKFVSKEVEYEGERK